MSIFDEVLAFINHPRPEMFDPLALAVFRYQFDNLPFYREFCVTRGVTPETITFFSQIPAASTVAFKYAEVRGPAADLSPSALSFTTSGTSKGFTERGRHLVPRPEIYRASAIAHLRRMLFPNTLRIAMLALHPTADRMPESSLSTMLSWCIEEFGADATMCAATRTSVDTAAALEFLDARQSRGEPVCILGTTAASAALFSAIAQRGRRIALAAGSRLMDTGGAKGQAIPLTPIEVVDRAHETLGIAPALVINEYGMTEMCSQLYDATPFNSARYAHTDHRGFRVKLAPPWLRPTVLDPITLRPLDDGRVGLLAFFDLANVGSISALMTEDFGMLQGGAVAILGRAAAGGSRGCALSIDEFACHEWDTRDHTGAIRSMVAIDEAAHADENAKVDRRVGGAMTIESSNTPPNLVALAAGLRSAMYRTARVANLVTPARVAAALGEACARWRDRSFAPRRETVAAIAAAWGWSEELLDESIDGLLAPFSIVALEDLARCVPQRSALVGLIMAGNIPGAGIHEIALALIAGCALLVKTSTAEPIFFARFAQTLREIDAEIGARIAVVNWSRERGDLMAALRANCDWLAAFGADETIATLASNARFAPSWHPPSSKATAAERGTAADNDQVADNVTGAARLAAGFGSRVSAALVATGMVPGAPATALADALARDVSLFEQQGCLSPHHIYVESSDGGAAREFARELAAALERCTAKLPPPRRYGLQEAAAVRRVRESARWRALGGDTVLMLEGAGLGWTVICDDAANFTPSPGYRTVTVSPIRDLDDLRRRLQPVASRIEACAIAAPPGRRERLHTALAALGICYLCEPGAMQSPPLDWNHGGGVFIRALVNSPNLR